MTQEEKAKAYDDAVAHAKRVLDGLAEDYRCDCVTKDDVRFQYSTLFPLEKDLKEDEDTLANRKLIYGLKCFIRQGKNTFAGTDIGDLIDYLERVKGYKGYKTPKWNTPKVDNKPIQVDNNTVDIPLPGVSTTPEEECEAAENRYDDEYSTGEYCHEQSFKWGFQEGIDWLKGRLPNVGLIQRSWYMEGFYDGKFEKEPMWNIKTGKGGPCYEKNAKHIPPIGRHKILREIERQLATWEEVEEAAVKSGKGHRGSSGDLCQVSTSELCNELFWRLENEN